MTQEIGNVFQGRPLFQQMRCACMPEGVGTVTLGLNMQKLEATAYNLPHGNSRKRAVRLAEGHKNISASAARPSLGEIAQDRLAHFILQRESLIPTSLCTLYAKRFLAPVKIAEPQANNLAAAKGIDGAKQCWRLTSLAPMNVKRFASLIAIPSGAMLPSIMHLSGQ